jgi:CRP/FNR family transcriptional regulator
MKLVSAGDILFGQGDSFEAPLVVTSGCVAVTEVLTDGAERIVSFRVPGEIVGLESWNRSSHRHGARAITDALLCRLRWSPRGSLARNPSLLRALLAKATAQSAETCMPWAGLAAVERVRAFLADFRRRTNQPLPMTRAQIGQYLGLAEETVVRAMKVLRAG